MKLLNLQISQAAINKRGNQEQDKNNNKWPQELFGQMFLETLIVSQGHGQKWSRHANPNRARAGKNQGQPGKSNPRPQPFPNVLKNFLRQGRGNAQSKKTNVGKLWESGIMENMRNSRAPE